MHNRGQKWGLGLCCYKEWSQLGYHWVLKKGRVKIPTRAVYKNRKIRERLLRDGRIQSRGLQCAFLV